MVEFPRYRNTACNEPCAIAIVTRRPSLAKFVFLCLWACLAHALIGRESGVTASSTCALPLTSNACRRNTNAITAGTSLISSLISQKPKFKQDGHVWRSLLKRPFNFILKTLYCLFFVDDHQWSNNNFSTAWPMLF